MAAVEDADSDVGEAQSHMRNHALVGDEHDLTAYDAAAQAACRGFGTRSKGVPGYPAGAGWGTARFHSCGLGLQTRGPYEPESDHLRACHGPGHGRSTRPLRRLRLGDRRPVAHWYFAVGIVRRKYSSTSTATAKMPTLIHCDSVSVSAYVGSMRIGSFRKR